MILQLKQIFEDRKRSLDVDVSISADELAGSDPYDRFAEPVRIKGGVTNRAGVVTLDMTVTAKLEHVCDRCLEEFQREYVYSFVHTLVTSLDNGDDEDEEYVVCPDNTLDIGELALTDLKLSMPTKILCKTDCKGLCPECGSNLNEGDCGCY